LSSNYRRVLRALTAFALSALLIEPALAKPGSEQLQDFLKGLGTLKAGFVQSIGPDTSSRVEGWLWLKRPGKFRWEYALPESQVIIADGETVWLIDRELDQVAFQSQDSALQGTPALLLSDTAPLEDHFQLSDIGRAGGLEWVSLKPNQEDAQFREIRLGLAEDQLQMIEMTDGLGQVTRMKFHNVQRNPELDAELFRYRPPIGADIIGDF
jgi:outer membrane lipoprotein carrier protein